MVRKLFFLGFVFLFFLNGCDSKTNADVSDSRNDSIKKYLELASDVNLDNEKRKRWNDIAYSFLDFTKNDSLIRLNLYVIGINNANLTRFDRLRENARDLSDLSIKSNNQKSTADSYKLRGLYFMYMSENEKAAEYFYKAKKIFLKLNAYRRLIAINKDIAQVQYFSNDFFGSNKTLFENLKNIKQSIEVDDESSKDLKAELFRNYTFIASNFASLKDYNQSILFEKKALENADKLTHFNISYLGIANCYTFLKEYDKAQYYINKILKNPKTKSVNPLDFYSAIAMQAHINMNLNRMDGLPEAFHEVENYYANNDDVGGQNYNLSNLSQYFLKVKDTANAINAAKRAVELSKSYRNPLDILASLDQLIKADKKNASKHAQEYICINDSMQKAERNFRDKFARIEFETDEITQQRNDAIKQKWIVSTISVILVIVIVLILIITRQRSKQKELSLLREQQVVNEEIYNLMLSQKNIEDVVRQQEKQRIAIELHDGVMNRLASTRFNLNVLAYRKDEETIEKCLSYVHGIYEIEKEIRHIAHDLNLEIFNSNNSYTSLLTDLISIQNSANTNYQLEVDKSINWINIPVNIKMNLYRIIQEACNNINKFSEAETAIISLILDESNLCLSITDDGKGFDTKKKSEGIGLKNIKLRVNNLHGKFVIQSNEKRTSLNIAVPLF